MTWLLYLQASVAVVGLVIAVWLFVNACRDKVALQRSNRNGANQLLIQADLLMEGVRILIHTMILVPTAWALMFFAETDDRTDILNAVSGWLLTLTLLVTLKSVISWRVRRALRHYIS